MVNKQYVASNSEKLGLLLNDLIGQESEDLKNGIEEDESLLKGIPTHQTELFRLCDVVIYESLRDRMKQCAPKRDLKGNAD